RLAPSERQKDVVPVIFSINFKRRLEIDVVSSTISGEPSFGLGRSTLNQSQNIACRFRLRHKIAQQRVI
ncbi:MAG: hypothetical protein JW795_16375, partial [Chitinivibrionales bacterium]|nr:hypothetical protein [Chitinivibrionales bacterium]